MAAVSVLITELLSTPEGCFTVSGAAEVLLSTESKALEVVFELSALPQLASRRSNVGKSDFFMTMSLPYGLTI